MKRTSWIVGLLCAALLLPGGAVAAEPSGEDYMAIFLAGKKIGYARHHREAAGGKVTTTEEMSFTVKRMGIAMQVKTVETAVETAAGTPLTFKAVLDMGILGQTVEGVVGQDGNVEVTQTTGERSQKKTLAWPEGAILPEGMRLLSRKMGLKEGTTYKAKAFSASLLTALDAEVTIGPKRDVDLLGRVVTLTESKVTMSAPTGKIETTSYVNDDFDALKTTMPMMGMQMELVTCTKEVALSPADPVEFFDRVLVTSPTPLEGVKTAKSITYYIQPTGKDARLTAISSTSQSVAKRQDGNMVVIVTPAAAPKGAKVPYDGDDAEAKAALKPTRYLECDDKEVAGLAKAAAGDSSDVAEAAAKVEAHVSKYISNKNLTVGYATAAETVKSRQGDCTEHAALAAAMCRALGIPAQVVTGVAHVKQAVGKADVFVPHAWFRVFAGGKWIDYDAALKGYDAGHIAFSAGDGDPTDFFGVVGTLGNFRLTKVTVEP